jgi:hypothetical protein
MQKQRSVALIRAVVGSLGLVLVVICAYGLKQAIGRDFDGSRS